MLKTVIFDMDGVIIDSEPVHRFAYFTLFDQLNIQVYEDLYTSFTGTSTINCFQKIKQHFNLKQTVDDLVNQKRDLFNNAFDQKKDLELIDGVLPLIHSLKMADINLILASSSAKITIERVFNRFELHPYFSGIFSGEDYEFSKPHPQIFLEAWQHSTHQKNECIVIEDSTNGILAAKAAGIFCVGYDSIHSKNQDYSAADLVVDHMKDIKINHLNQLLLQKNHQQS